MRDSINLSKSINSSLNGQLLEVSNNVLDAINKKILRANDKPKRPKVTQVRPPLEQQNFPNPTALDTKPKRPKVTSVVVKRRKVMEQDNYEFTFSIDMYDLEGDITIIFEFMKEGAALPYTNEFPFANVVPSTTELISPSNDISYFDNLSAGNYAVSTFVIWNGELIEPLELYTVNMQFSIPLVKSSLGQRVRNFFKRLFKGTGNR